MWVRRTQIYFVQASRRRVLWYRLIALCQKQVSRMRWAGDFAVCVEYSQLWFQQVSLKYFFLVVETRCKDYCKTLERVPWMPQS